MFVRWHIIFLLFMLACQSRPVSPVKVEAKTDSAVANKPYDWQEGFGLTHDPMKDSVWGKPVQYYLDQPDCSLLARAFYFGVFRPADNDSTAALLDLATTPHAQLRPFYRWCLNKTIQIQDGALAEYTGVPARRYAEQFPIEFFDYMDQDSSGNRYQDWTAAINYSGIYDTEDYKQTSVLRQNFAKEMIQHCSGCSQDWVRRIKNFIGDCF